MKFLSGAWHRFDTITSDVFWNTATSYPMLVAIGIVALFAFGIAHLPLVEKFFPSIAPYIRAAALVSVVSTAALLFLIGFRVADQREEAARLRRDLAFSELQLDGMKKTADEASELKRVADAKAKQAKDELDGLRKKFGRMPKSGGAYPREFLRWLRTRHSRAK
jgi:hypothetical protein